MRFVGDLLRVVVAILLPLLWRTWLKVAGEDGLGTSNATSANRAKPTSDMLIAPIAGVHPPDENVTRASLFH